MNKRVERLQHTPTKNSVANYLQFDPKCLDEWYKETKQESSQATDGNGLKNH